MDDETTEQTSQEMATPGEAIVEVDIEAAPSDVWHALTTDDGLASWIGEGSTIGTKPGDDLHVHDVVSGKNKRGVLDEVTPHRRLGYTWWPETAPEQATRVAISLEPWHGGTRVRVIESQTIAVPTGTPGALIARASVAASSSTSTSTIAGAWQWRAAMLAVAVSRSMRMVLRHQTMQPTY